MKNQILLFAFLLYQAINYAQAPDIEWEKNYGGDLPDELFSIVLSDDGGYVVTGRTSSNNFDVVNTHGFNDAWIIKLNASGDTIWTSCIGGSQSDWAYAMDKTFDNGYIITGHTDSDDGDVSGFHGIYDVLTAKLDSNGNTIWVKCYGGSLMDQSRCIQQTADSGYVIGGRTTSNDGDISGNHGGEDYLIIKTDRFGNIVWSKCYGGSADDQVLCLSQTSEDGYIIAGMSESNDGDVYGSNGGKDVWIIRTDQYGDTLWTKCYGGSSSDWANSIIETSDGGFILTGRTNSLDGDVQGGHGGADIWVVKLNSAGNIEWQKCFGGSNYEGGNLIQETSDNGYIIVGETNSIDYDVNGVFGDYDFWIIKTDQYGDTLWTKTLGGSLADYGISIKQIPDGYIVGGWSESFDGDVANNYGSHDIWVIKLATPTNIESIISDQLFKIYPNPTNGKFTVYANEIKNISILNTESKVIYKGIDKEIDISQSPKGIYIIKVTTEKGVVVEKVVLE